VTLPAHRCRTPAHQRRTPTGCRVAVPPQMTQPPAPQMGDPGCDCAPARPVVALWPVRHARRDRNSSVLSVRPLSGPAAHGQSRPRAAPARSLPPRKSRRIPQFAATPRRPGHGGRVFRRGVRVGAAASRRRLAIRQSPRDRPVLRVRRILPLPRHPRRRAAPDHRRSALRFAPRSARCRSRMRALRLRGPRCRAVHAVGAGACVRCARPRSAPPTAASMPPAS